MRLAHCDVTATKEVKKERKKERKKKRKKERRKKKVTFRKA